MSDMYPQYLPSLSERDAVADALYWAAIGCDHNDAELFNSAWAGEDVSFEIHDDNKRVMSGLSIIRKNILEIVGPMDTTHNTAMVRVNLKDGADTATLTAISTAQHSPPGMGRDPTGPKYTTGGEYSVDLIRDESGVWRIKKLVLCIIWTQGDASLMRPKSEAAA
ncbi:hypothetical protein C8A01DRAFT_40104 [Parachaetomium inaequale]|uniref:SnoaL-like domain-containing protein n=1 Tax=Parachaetomium inaequale TaxID=2588326 RepID=A0AAN6PBQ7_9PEZI|nr:hypothetical protein C8A01DRAFT_40104 [Parachaetomium inaequale]